ncbi:unnamed protein product, partial [Ectocarpus fasciculatus]
MVRLMCGPVARVVFLIRLLNRSLPVFLFALSRDVMAFFAGVAVELLPRGPACHEVAICCLAFYRTC